MIIAKSSSGSCESNILPCSRTKMVIGRRGCLGYTFRSIFCGSLRRQISPDLSVIADHFTRVVKKRHVRLTWKEVEDVHSLYRIIIYAPEDKEILNSVYFL
jgi:hypothetical protein